MQSAVAREIDVVLHDAVAADRRFVSQYAAITDPAVMRNVRVDHEKIVAADARRPGLSRSAVNRHVLAKDIAVADLQARRLTVVFEVLRSFAEYAP